MFDHVSLRGSDRSATEAFYDAVLPAIGVDQRHTSPHSTLFGHFELSVTGATPERPVTTGLHVGLRAPSTDAVHAFWDAGTAAGYASDGAPGPRPQYGSDYYGAFLRDPDGNSVEAVHHDAMRERGLVDHLWMRTTDVPALRRFYALVAESAGLVIRADEPGRLFRIRGPRGGSLTFVAADQATQGVHIAIPADRGTIDAWYAASMATGFTSDGPPGPRPYHPSYYGAFVLDPDGHSAELVDHGGLLGDRW